MKRTALGITMLLGLLPAPLIGQVTAEPWFRAGTFMLTLDAGGAAFTDLARTQARPISTAVPLGDFSRRVSAHTAISFGGWVSYWVRNGLGVRGGVSYVPTSFTVWNDESAQRTLGQYGDETPPPEYASLGILMADASVVFRFPASFGRIVPYGIVGGGVIRYSSADTAAMPPEARARFAEGDWQTGAFMFGVGATLPLQRRNLLMSFELTNHMARSPLRDAPAGQTFELSGVPLMIQPEEQSQEAIGTTNHLRLAIGLTLPIR